MSKYFSGHQVFRDWIEVYALSIANCCEPEGTPVFEKREQQYLSTINMKRRRTCATMALKRGMPVEQVSKMLGHEELTTTQIYLDLDERNLEIAHEKYVV